MTTSLGPVTRRAVGWGIRLASLAIIATYTACASSSITTTGPTNQGEFSASVIIAADTAQLSGNAIFSTSENTDGLVYLVFYLWTGTPGGTAYNVFWFQRENLDLPEPGGYVIADVYADSTALDDFVALYAFADTAAATFHSVSGNFTVDASAFDEVTGAFEFLGALDENSYHSGTVGDTVQVSGTFTAAAGTIY